MCGIAGYIGQSKNPEISYNLITNIFKHLETRGTDASGIWGVEGQEKAKIIYHKAPIKSSEFIKVPSWDRVQNLNPNLLLVHARRTSPGVGHARNNENNHPFVSEDHRIGLIHNGKIHEASFLSDKYETQTECDSEILLRMYENAIREEPLRVPNAPDFMNERLGAVHELWSVIKQGSCAAMAAELHLDGSRTLMVYRNDKRPLWAADLRETLGQIFLFSSTDIWHKALETCKHTKDLGPQKLAELPVNEVWGFKIDNEQQMVTDANFHRIKIKRDKSLSRDWVAGEKKPIASKVMNLSVVTELDDKGNAPLDQVPKPKTYQQTTTTSNGHQYSVHGPWADEWCDRWGHADMLPADDLNTRVLPVFEDDEDGWNDNRDTELEDLSEEVCDAANDLSSRIENIKRLLDDIETNYLNSAIEGSLSDDLQNDILQSLEQTYQDLEGTAHFLNIG